jgi:ethanolamine ammonia-lyase small subunit
MEDNELIQSDPWSSLKAFTTARIALGRTGTAIPLKEVLAFKMAHAHARDAVYSRLDINTLEEQLHPVTILHSRAADRYEYLQRPDKGRRLDDESIASLKPVNADIAFILVDGLSATAVNIHAYPLLQHILPLLKEIKIAPICLVQQGRVAIGDEIGALLNVKLTVVLIGERPGLSAADSLGAYITYAPKVGNTDEVRNCISNIREDGLQYTPAAEKIFYLVKEAMRLKLSGVALKDNHGLLK